MNTISLEAIRRDDDANSRVTGRDAGLDELAASILAHGLLQPLMVRRSPSDEGKVLIVDGHRRFAAILRLVKAGKLDGDIQVPVHYGAFEEGFDAERAREASLAANIVRVPLHPIDQFEAFQAMTNKFTPAQIAERFGVTERLVKQRIALGALHPTIRQAWRNNKVQDDAARAFTLIPDEKEQFKIFKKLVKAGRLWANTIRAEIGADQNAGQALRIIGAAAYEAAGGRIVQDLFGEEHVVSDPALVKRLLAERLQAECDRLVADGWSFAICAETVKDRWNWPALTPSGKRAPTKEESVELKELEGQIKSLQEAGDRPDGLLDADKKRLREYKARKDEIEATINLRRWGPKQKKEAGCFVEAAWPGEIKITYGVQNPKDTKKKAAKAEAKNDAEASAEPAPSISNALNLALSEQLTIAASKTLAQDPLLALRVTVATLERRFRLSPMKLRNEGYEALETAEDEAGNIPSFEQALAELLATSDEAVLGRLAIAVSKALDMRNHNGGGPSGQDLALISALNADDFTNSAREVFDAAAYFKSINAGLCNRALDEMGFAMAGGRPKKKGELAAMCVEAAKIHGWLPPPLRHPKGGAVPETSASQGREP